MLWRKSKTQLTIVLNEAPVKNEIKAPKIRIRPKIKSDQVGQLAKGLFDTLQLQLIECLTGRTSLSHVVGVEVLPIYYSLSCAGGWLSQHYCVVAAAILIKSQ